MAGDRLPASRYREVEIRTASPQQLIVILYDGAIQSIQEAKEHLGRGNVEARSRALNRALAIISELQASLNFEVGGRLADSLESLYAYMNRRIFAAGFGKMTEPLDEVISLLATLRSAWADIAQQGIAAAAAAAAAGSEQRPPQTGTGATSEPGAVNISC